jgi:tetratricopeptide (TPR) repeat protein
VKTASAIPTLALVLLAGGTALARPHKRIKRPRPAPAAGSEAEGRSHLKKANALASHNDCEAAIEEYTQAFDRLNDPAVLLARADCRQKIGQNAEAVEDYRAYLDESPDVANRADIEAKIEKIAVLEGAPAKAAPAKAAPATKEPAPKESAAAREPPQTKEAPRPKEAARPKEPARPPESAPAPAAAPPPVSPAAEAEEGLGAKPLVGAAVVTREGPAAEARPAGGHARLWLWTALAVVVAGGAATAGYFYFRPEPATPPATSLGNYRF